MPIEVQQSEAKHVLVLGAGIIGVCAALRAVRRGMRVTLVDRLPPGDATSYGNAGVLATCSFVPVTVPGLLGKVPKLLADPLGPLYLRWRSLPRLMPWLMRYLANCEASRSRSIAKALSSLTADSYGEHFEIARGTAAERRVRKMAYAFAYRNRAGFEADAFGWNLRREFGTKFEVYEGAAASAVEPTLGSNYQCLVVAEEQHGTIDEPGEYVKDLAAAFVAEGGSVVQAEVAKIQVSDGSVRGVQLVSGEMLDADAVVVAAGVWSARLLEPLGINIPLEAERGYHVELSGCNKAPRHALSVTDGKFVATAMGDKLRLAGLVELASIDAPPIKAPIRTLLGRAEQIFDGLQYDSYTEWMGRRPATPDSLPVIGELPGAKGVHMAFGHQHIGLTCAPRTARLLVDNIAGSQANVDMSAYAVERFS
jgi:D-amino-acid dehydrogenase